MKPEQEQRAKQLLEQFAGNEDCETILKDGGYWHCRIHEWYGDPGETCPHTEARELLKELS